jgi:hypothetical protein
MSVALEGTAFEQAGAVVTETSLKLARPGELTWEQYERLGSFLGQLGQAYCWWVGDFLLYGEDVFGEEYAQIEASLPYSMHTLENYRSMAKRIPPERRRRGLSFGVHETVAYLEPQEREAWLDRAEVEGWKRDSLREAIRDAKALGSGEEEPKRCPCCGKDLE